MFVTRAATALAALVFFLAALFFLPPAAWALLMLAGLAVAGWEWGALAHYGGFSRAVYAAVIVASAAAVYFAAHSVAAAWETPLYALSLAFWVLVAPLWLAQGWSTRNRLAVAAAGWIALVPMWLALVRLQATPWALLMFMSIVWLADTAAYLAGKTWGRRKIAPSISPGKTWEGAFGALAAVAVYYAVLLLAADPGRRYLDGWPGLAVFAALFVLSVEGDLFESWMKRQAGVKDSGHILPGHGGILDRIDGLTSTLPAAAIALILMSTP